MPIHKVHSLIRKHTLFGRSESRTYTHTPAYPGFRVQEVKNRSYPSGINAAYTSLSAIRLSYRGTSCGSLYLKAHDITLELGKHAFNGLRIFDE